MFLGDEFKIVNETYSSFFKFYDLYSQATQPILKIFKIVVSQMLILWEIALSRI